ncbi:hypothetical protein OPT61_g6744 [Boeremia exigua]|uniref:Uncharacterized protein n=1 Tax=Boeremia exigua TaxID=749465 RepID=A0ACC2I4V1_9PLEO|nr:hypothetical protein OPT61_g6744 [Boeremia exigua]
MASSTDAAPTRIGHESDHATTGKVAFTSQMPHQATVEDYVSDQELQYQRLNRNRAEADGFKEPQPKPIIGKPAISKQANVSWADKPHSWLSEATTTVAPDLDHYGRAAARKIPFASVDVRGSAARSPGEVPAPSKQRGAQEEERYNQIRQVSHSGEDDEWGYRRAHRVPGGRRQPSPDMYMTPRTRDTQTVNESMEQRGRVWDLEPAATGPFNRYSPINPPNRNDIAPTPYLSWSHPHPDTFARYYPNPFEHPRDSRISEQSLFREPVPQRQYQNTLSPSRSQGGYAPSSPPPLPPQRLPSATPKESLESCSNQNDASSSAQKRVSTTPTQAVDVSDAGMAAKYRDLAQNLQKALACLGEGPVNVDKTPLKDLESILTQGSSSTVVSQTLTSLTDLDLIKLMEQRMQTLKQKNEAKLIEANQVLTYLRQSSERGQQSSDRSIEPVRLRRENDADLRMPNVHDFRTPEDETDYSDDTEDSDVTDGDSIAGNSSGSSISFSRQRTRHADVSQETVESQLDESSETESLTTTTDGSTSSVVSVHNSKASESESFRSMPGTTEHVQDGGVGKALAKPASEIQLQNEMMGEVVALRRDLSILKKQMTSKNKTWLGKTFISAFFQCKRYFREAPRPGTQRLEWICECGDEMYADLPVENGAQHQQMLEFFTRPGPKPQQAIGSQTTPSQLEGGTVQSDYTSLQASQSSFGQGAVAVSTIGSGSTYVGSGSSQFLVAQQNTIYPRNKFLELCVNVGKYETQLAEIQVSSSQSNGAAICTDAHLFRQIYHRYFALRKHTWRRYLYRPVGIKFVHFGVQAGYRVSFFSSDPLPSEEEITAKRYEYSLQPPVPPPIDSRTFLHYFYKHNAHSHSTSAKYVNRLPKKLGDSLTRSLGVDDLLEGWGIHIIEGPNKVAICWALMIVLIASLGMSIGYDFVTKSGDSGFAIGQWMVAALTVALSALYFSLEDDVNSKFD